MHARVSSSVRVDYAGSPEFGAPGAGTTPDFERTLGLPRTQTRGGLSLGVGMAELNVYRQPAPNLAAGLGVRHVQHKLDRKRSGELSGSCEYRFTAPQVALELAFWKHTQSCRRDRQPCLRR